MLENDGYTSFEDHLHVLTEMPSCFEMEAQVREYCEDILRRLGMTTERDAFGNLFATRLGGRQGHILLCAHMDKRIDANMLGMATTQGNVLIRSGVFYLIDRYRCRFFSPHKGRFQEIRLKRLSEGCMVALPGKPAPDQGKWVFALPVLVELDGLLFGKFDDAWGLATILDVLQRTQAENCPTISALLTVGEERGLRGATYAVKNHELYELNPDEIIVLDTCPKANPGEGLILYEDCGRVKGNPADEEDFRPPELVSRLGRFAQDTGVQLKTLPASRNDGLIFGRHTTFPTVSLEVPIDYMHEAVETIARNDVELMRQFLKGFLQDDLCRNSGGCASMTRRGK